MLGGKICYHNGEEGHVTILWNVSSTNMLSMDNNFHGERNYEAKACIE